MNSEELIAAIRKADPSGTNEVWIAIDAGEGYVPLEKVFSDQLRKQPIDRDEMSDGPDHAMALFLGDNHADPSPEPVYDYEMSSESFMEFSNPDSDDYNDTQLILKFETIREAFTKKMGVELPDMDDMPIKISLNDLQTELIITAPIHSAVPKYINPHVAEAALFDCIHEIEKLKGVDKFGRQIQIHKING